MSFFIAGAIVVTGVATQIQARRGQKKAQKRAEQQALEDRRNARKSEVFAETEGQGLGNLGRVSLEVDREIDDEESNVVRV